MEEQVLKIGKCSGRDVDKFDALSVATCEPGWCSDRSQYEYMMPPKVFRKYRDISPHIAISACVAHIVCKLHKIEAQENDGGHLFLFAEMLYAFVRPQYWNGKCFIGPCPKEVATQLDNPSGASQGKNAEAEPLLTFLGSGRFAHMVMPPESVGH
jgi:flavin reductase (DIM6/NTAB) family NADH-FMN oxidoreductase RutF